jgi:hypothetical protein
LFSRSFLRAAASDTSELLAVERTADKESEVKVGLLETDDPEDDVSDDEFELERSNFGFGGGR